MNIDDLKSTFEENYVPTQYYSFGGMGGGDCYVFEKDQSGWLIFYSERGSRNDARKFETEDAACRYMFQMIKEMVEGSQHRLIMLNIL